MSQIAQFEDRIEAALERITAAVGEVDLNAAPDEEALEEAREQGAAQAREEQQDALDRFAAEIAQLKEALDAEQTANAQLRERVQTLKGKKDRLSERVAELETQTTELQDRRKADRAELDDLIGALEPLVKEGV